MASLVPIVEPQSLPLADYFFICGLETSRLFDSPSSLNGINGYSSPTIDEDTTYDADERPGSKGTQDGQRRRARFSYEARKSIGSIINLDSQAAPSNRSSATIRPVLPEEKTDEQGFLKAIQSFASNRESFLDDINAATLFSSGQVAQPNRPRPKPKTQRIINEDRKDDRGVGSLRRRISTMNPLSRQSTSSKRCKRQTARLDACTAFSPNIWQCLRGSRDA